MRVLLYTKNEKVFSKSGIGRAMEHQKIALERAGVSFTQNPEDDYDIVHVNTVDPSSIGMIMKAQRHNKKVVVHAHSTKEDFRNSFVFSNQLAPLFKWHLINVYKMGDIILTPTPYSKRILESYGLENPIYAVSNGIELNKYAYNQEKVDAFRAHFNLAEDAKVVVSVGLYFERKGLHDFIEIARSLPEVTFIWFGHTPLSSTTPKIREAINTKPDNVILPGYISGDIIEGAYQCADLFFFPSYEETEGIVVLEALASRCQVLVRNIGVYDEWLYADENCYMAESNDAFIDKITRILNGELPSTIEAGYEVAKSKSIEEIGQELKACYEKVMAI